MNVEGPEVWTRRVLETLAKGALGLPEEGVISGKSVDSPVHTK